MSKHSWLGGSGAKRWMHCAGSVKLCRDLEEELGTEESSVEAELGTAAHTLLERVLRSYFNDNLGGGNAFDHIGETILNESGQTFVVDSNMAQAVQVAVDYVLGRIEQLGPDTEVILEGDVDLTTWQKKFGIKEPMFGRADIVLIQPFGVLEVIDYKHGEHVTVEVEGNEQAKYYGFGVLTKNDPCIEEVVNTIIQPRREHELGYVRSETIRAEDLQAWGDTELAPCAKATESPRAQCHAGEWCKTGFCRGMGVCPATAARVEEIAELTVFEGAAIPVSQISNAKLARIIDLSTLLAKCVKSAKEIAQARLRSGQVVGGYKLVQGKASRHWINEDRARHAMREWASEATESKLLSPAAMETMLKNNGMKKGEITAMIGHLINTTRGEAIAPASSKKPEVLTAVSAFKHLGT